ncbi:MAG TPA: histidine kinase [Clostridiales bacterium]|nr:histidine kinase [Clostridiales bacterium]
MKNSIFQRTILIIAVSFFFILFCVFGILYYTSIESVKEQTVSSAQSNLEMIRSYLDMMLKHLTNSMYLYVQNEVLLSNDIEAINSFVKSYPNTHEYIDCVMLLDGNEVLAINNSMLINSLDIDTSIYKEMAKKNRLVMTKPYYSVPLAGRAIALIRSLVDEQTGKERLFVVEFRPQNLFSSISNKMTSRETLVVLTAEGETVYFDYKSPFLEQLVIHKGQLDINDSLRTELTSLRMGINELTLGSNQMIVKRLRFNQYWRLYILAEYSLFYEALIYMINTYKLIGAAALILLVVISAVISSSIIKPVKQLSLQVDSLSPEILDDSTLALPVQRKDEIGKLASSFNKLISRLQAASREKEKAERIRLELEYKVLQSQIKPHFLFNIHMCMNSLLEQGRTEEARRMLLALDSLLRVSTDKIDQLITLDEELETVRQYVVLQQMRLGSSFDFKMEGWEPYADVKVPKLLLQPIVENSIYHGFANIKHQGEVKIKFTEIDGYLHIIIQDNGCGMPQSALEQKLPEKPDKYGMVSIGIENVRQRIKNLYGNDCGLYISSRENIGTRVEIVVKMHD